MKTKRAKRGASGEGVEQPSPPSRRQIFIVDDHPVFREGMVHLVNNEEGLAVCGEAGSAEEALPALQKCHSDLVLVDVSLPGRSGLQLVKDLRALDSGLKLLVVSMHDEALYADRALRAGADGYIMKEEDPDEILRAIRDVLAGRIYVSEAVLASGTTLPNGNAS